MKLISMVAFVLEWNRKMFIIYSDRDYTFQEYCQAVISYARFLKKTLELWMFVPCDKKGNVLSKPNPNDYKDTNSQTSLGYDGARFNKDSTIYQQAKERVLFKITRFENAITHVHVYYKDGCITFGEPEMNVERLIAHGWDIELTKTAQKQIGI